MPCVAAGAGKSCRDDSFAAGKEAASEALKNHGGKPDVALVFASPEFKHIELLAGVSSVLGDINMVGGTTAGEISMDGFSTGSVVIMCLSSEELVFSTCIAPDMSRDEKRCAEFLAEEIKRQKDFDDALSLIVFPNGIGGDGVKVIEGLHSVLGADFEILGGYLGDNDRFSLTFQYHNGKVYRDAIVALLISGKGAFRTGIGVRSGFESIGNRMYCTESEGNVVMKLDGEPALDLYKEFLGEKRAERLPGICLEYPFGLIDERVSIAGEEFFQLRCAFNVDHSRGTMTLAGSIPEGSALTLTTGSRGDIINGAKYAAEQAMDCIRGSRPRAALMFSCVGRKLVLGRRVQEEIMAVRGVVGEDVPFIGFYTYGEMGPIDKMDETLSTTRFHNETVVVWILGAD